MKLFLGFVLYVFFPALLVQSFEVYGENKLLTLESRERHYAKILDIVTDEFKSGENNEPYRFLGFKVFLLDSLKSPKRSSTELLELRDLNESIDDCQVKKIALIEIEYVMELRQKLKSKDRYYYKKQPNREIFYQIIMDGFKVQMAHMKEADYKRELLSFLEKKIKGDKVGLNRLQMLQQENAHCLNILEGLKGIETSIYDDPEINLPDENTEDSSTQLSVPGKNN